MTRSRAGEALVAAAVGIGAAAVIFALQRSPMHDVMLHGADQAYGDRPAVGIDGPGTDREANGVRRPQSRAGHDDTFASAEGERDRGIVPVDSLDGEPRDDAAGNVGADLEHVDRPMRSPHADALRHPSEAFRNASLLALIRDAGYLCLDIVSSAAWNESASAWRVSCEGVHAYIVIELDNGSFLVEPLETYDAPVPNPITLPSDRLPPLEPR